MSEIVNEFFPIVESPGDDDLIPIFPLSMVGTNFDALTRMKFFVKKSSLGNGGGVTTENDIIAHDGGGQADATPLTATWNRVTTVANADDSVLAPISIEGSSFIVINVNGGGRVLDIYPQIGETFDSNGTDAPFVIGDITSVMFVCIFNGTWTPISLLTGFN